MIQFLDDRRKTGRDGWATAERTHREPELLDASEARNYLQNGPKEGVTEPAAASIATPQRIRRIASIASCQLRCAVD